MADRLSEMAARLATKNRVDEADFLEWSLLALRLADRRRWESERDEWRARQEAYDRCERERRLLVARSRGVR